MAKNSRLLLRSSRCRLDDIATQYNTVQRVATHFNTLQHRCRAKGANCMTIIVHIFADINIYVCIYVCRDECMQI